MENLKCWGRRLLKWGIIGLVLIFGIKMIAPDGKQQPAGAKPVATDSSRKYAGHHNWQGETREFFVKTIEIPERSQGWVSIAAPVFYRLGWEETCDAEYDIGGGKVVTTGPNLPRITVETLPATFDVRAIGSGGTLTIRFYRNAPDKKKEKEVVKKVSSKRVSMRADYEVNSQQVM